MQLGIEQGVPPSSATLEADELVTNMHSCFLQKSPSQGVSMTAISPKKYMIINQAKNKVIEEVEENKVFFEVYEGVVYMHQGETFLCTMLDTTPKVALCTEADLKYYTKTRDFTNILSS